MVNVKLEFQNGAPIEAQFQAVPRTGELVRIKIGGMQMTYEVKHVVHSPSLVILKMQSSTYDADVPSQ